MIEPLISPAVPGVSRVAEIRKAVVSRPSAIANNQLGPLKIHDRSVSIMSRAHWRLKAILGYREKRGRYYALIERVQAMLKRL